MKITRALKDLRRCALHCLIGELNAQAKFAERPVVFRLYSL